MTSETAGTGIPAPSVRRFRTNDPRRFWWLLAGVNAGILLLCLPVAATGGPTGLVVLAVLWVVTNAILVPVCAVGAAKSHEIDFATGAITPSRGAPLAPADFVMLTHRMTGGRGIGHELRLVYRTGEFTLPLGHERWTQDVIDRRSAVLWVLRNRLSLPESARVRLSDGALVREDAIGRAEAAELLLNRTTRETGRFWRPQR